MYLHGTSKINKQGHLKIGGYDGIELTKQYSTLLIKDLKLPIV